MNRKYTSKDDKEIIIVISQDDFIYLSAVFDIQDIFGLKSGSLSKTTQYAIASLLNQGAIAPVNDDGISVSEPYKTIFTCLHDAEKLLVCSKDDKEVCLYLGNDTVCFEYCANGDIRLTLYENGALNNILSEQGFLPDPALDKDIQEMTNIDSYISLCDDKKSTPFMTYNVLLKKDAAFAGRENESYMIYKFGAYYVTACNKNNSKSYFYYSPDTLIERFADL